MRLPWKQGSFCQAEECVCSREKGVGRDACCEETERLVRRDHGGGSREASWPSSLFCKRVSPQLGTAPTGAGQLSWPAALEEPHCGGSAKGTSASSGKEINIYHGSPLSSQTLGSRKKNKLRHKNKSCWLSGSWRCSDYNQENTKEKTGEGSDVKTVSALHTSFSQEEACPSSPQFSVLLEAWKNLKGKVQCFRDWVQLPGESSCPVVTWPYLYVTRAGVAPTIILPPLPGPYHFRLSSGGNTEFSHAEKQGCTDEKEGSAN